MPIFSVRAELYPTEDTASVRRAVANLFPDSTVTEEGAFLVCHPAEITQLITLITGQKTRYAFVEELSRKTEGNGFRILLNKQAALAGRVNIVDEPKPLGSIEFSGVVDNPVIYFEKLLDITGYVSSRQEGDSLGRYTQDGE